MRQPIVGKVASLSMVPGACRTEKYEKLLLGTTALIAAGAFGAAQADELMGR